MKSIFVRTTLPLIEGNKRSAIHRAVAEDAPPEVLAYFATPLAFRIAKIVAGVMRDTGVSLKWVATAGHSDKDYNMWFYWSRGLGPKGMEFVDQLRRHARLPVRAPLELAEWDSRVAFEDDEP
jgi:hypothetical protein